MLADLFSRYLANVCTIRQVSTPGPRVCVDEDTVRWWLPSATPAISHAPASAEWKCAGEVMLASLPSAPLNKTLKSFAIKESVVSFPPPFQKGPLHRKSVVSPFMDTMPCGLPWKWVLALLCRGTPPLINWGGLREKNVIKDSHFIMTAIFRGGWGGLRFKG